ncbi:MAG: TIGR04066 family peptide maturation system protein [Syntrophomonadaceae bacterium]|nr:TIGR04066 family peptide maturation system protein [Syntrophomonadaceae bacterium]
MQKVLVYPYDREFAPCLRHRDMLEGYVIDRVVSPSGWGLNGKDAGIVDGGTKLGLIVTDDFSDGLKSCDTVFLVDSQHLIDHEQLIKPRIIEALNAKKNVLPLLPLSAEFFGANLLSAISQKPDILEFDPYYEMNKIDTPVVGVIGIASDADKFYIQLALRQEFKKLGYKVSQIGSRPYSELFGIHSFPQYIFNAPISETEKIKAFNCFVKAIEDREKPDVIILGVPGEMMPFNDRIYTDFGLLPFEVFQAIQADALVVSIFAERISKEYLEEINYFCRYRFGLMADCFNLSHQIIDWIEMGNRPRQIDTCTISISQIEEMKNRYVRDFKMPVFDAIDSNDASHMAELLIRKLQSYSLQEV